MCCVFKSKIPAQHKIPRHLSSGTAALLAENVCYFEGRKRKAVVCLSKSEFVHITEKLWFSANKLHLKKKRQRVIIKQRGDEGQGSLNCYGMAVV